MEGDDYPERFFKKLIEFSGSPNKALTLGLFLQQGELTPLISKLAEHGMNYVARSGYFVKISRNNDKIEIQFIQATSIGRFDDPEWQRTTPQPVWGCVHITVSERDLNSTTFEKAEYKVFFLPREPSAADEAYNSGTIPVEEARLQFDKEHPPTT